MKCNVCGNELNPKSTKCSVCGSTNTNNSNLKSAISNISSLANALRSKREVKEQQTAFAKDVKKVSTLDEDMEELYTKDVSFEPDESEFTDDFDLNAFYENAKNLENEEKERKRKEVEEFEKEEPFQTEALRNEEVIEENHDFKEEKVKEESKETFDFDVTSIEDPSLDNVNEDIQEDKLETPNNEEPIVDETHLINAEESKIDFAPIVETEEPIVEEKPFISLEKAVEQEINEFEVKEESSKPKPIDIIEETNTNLETNKNSIQEEVVDTDIIKPTVEESNINMGYIKETDIRNTDEVQETDSSDGVNSIESSQEDNSPIVDLEPTTPDPVKEEKKEETFQSVKAEEVPYTQLEEKSDSKVSDTNPIKIDEKDIVNPDNRTEEAISQDAEEKPAKAKGNRFFGIMSIIFLVATVLAFGVIMLYLFVIKDSSSSNAVFDFINEFVSEYLMWCILGTLGACILSFLFGIIQILVKPRKMGKILVILTILLTAGICVAYYFTDNLIPAIDFLKGLFT